VPGGSPTMARMPRGPAALSARMTLGAFAGSPGLVTLAPLVTRALARATPGARPTEVAPALTRARGRTAALTRPLAEAAARRSTGVSAMSRSAMRTRSARLLRRAHRAQKAPGHEGVQQVARIGLEGREAARKIVFAILVGPIGLRGLLAAHDHALGPQATRGPGQISERRQDHGHRHLGKGRQVFAGAASEAVSTQVQALGGDDEPGIGLRELER
jgi:hypothetical protein